MPRVSFFDRETPGYKENASDMITSPGAGELVSSWAPSLSGIKTAGFGMPSRRRTVTSLAEHLNSENNMVSTPISVVESSSTGLSINTRRKSVSFPLPETQNVLEALSIFDEGDAKGADDDSDLDFKEYWASSATLAKRATSLDRDVDEVLADVEDDEAYLMRSTTKRTSSRTFRPGDESERMQLMSWWSPGTAA